MAQDAPRTMDAWLNQEGDWVEPPNMRRGGESGVMLLAAPDGGRLYRKQQMGHIYRSLRHPGGYPTAMREYRALVDCLNLGVQVPRPVFADCRKIRGHWQAVLVTEGLEGYASLEHCYEKGLHKEWGDALHERIFEEIGRVLARLNRGGRQHGCLRLKHIFVRFEQGEPRIALLDMEKSRKRLLRSWAIQHDIKQMRRRANETAELWSAFARGYEQEIGRPIQALRNRIHRRT